jgi:hypothetical protein
MIERSILSFDNEELQNVPFIVSFAYPCYKRPSLHQEHYVESGQSVKDAVINEISFFVLDCLGGNEREKVETKDVRQLYETDYFSEYFMRNKPWNAVAVIQGEWYEITPTFEEIAVAVDQKLQEKKTRSNSLNSNQDSNSDFELEDEMSFDELFK